MRPESLRVNLLGADSRCWVRLRSHPLLPPANLRASPRSDTGSGPTGEAGPAPHPNNWPVTQAYDPREIESRWQARWASEDIFRTPNPGDPEFDPSQPKYFVLDFFPYPSGAGLHVGHPMGYIGTDIVARRKRMEGCNVLHPMGFDAFGLPAEQFAIQSGKHPAETTAANMETFRRQMRMIGLSYDWSREVATCDPKFYHWTQWIFARLYDRGLAYQSEVPVWWCEALKTVLSNEEVINGRSERGDHPCVRRPLKQWMLRITAYAERLLADLDQVDWPESVKTMQREWIGRSEGAEIEFEVEGAEERLTVFTTRPDTVWGATFMVVAPEHSLLDKVPAGTRAEVAAYAEAAASKTELERTDLAKEKSGVFTGLYARNPVFAADDPRARIPIWVADYVLASYGTGAIMAVPGQDERDWEFAERFDLPIVRTVQPPEDFEGDAYTGEGPAINSGWLDGLEIAQAKAKTIEWLEREGRGRAKVTYKLRDWLFSRQRYWGEPFPVLHFVDGRHERVRDEDLPVLLPEMEDFRPPDDGSPPLSKATEWVETTDPVSGEKVLRDTDTMPGWAGSCWYYLRFMDPHNDARGWSEQAVNYWQNVDLYVGGAEHAVLHLLYARFWHKVLYDEGLVPTREPFQKLFNQGMLTAFAYKDPSGRLVPAQEVSFDGDKAKHSESGEELEQVIAKMSKSLRNVVNPDEVCEEYGVDTFRLYEMFMGPLADSAPWNPRDIPGCRRFLERVWRLFVDPDGQQPLRPELSSQAAGEPTGEALDLERALNRCFVQVDRSFEHFNFNTAIAACMTFVNEASKRVGALRRDQAERFVLALSPFAPHVCEELWSRLGHSDSLARESWPEVDSRYLEEQSYELVVQVRGKLRARVTVSQQAGEEEAVERAREAAERWLEGQEVVKIVHVPKRLVNFVVR